MVLYKEMCDNFAPLYNRGAEKSHIFPYPVIEFFAYKTIVKEIRSNTRNLVVKYFIPYYYALYRKNF